jgi:hypothetical protein
MPPEDAIRYLSKIKYFHLALLGCALLATAPRCFASAALFLEEPYGRFGAVNPTGHSAIYLDHICAAAPDRLRFCRPGETGVVVSRYHKVAGYDWLAVPLIPYLYGVDRTDEVPASVSSESVAEIRNTYRHDHLQNIVPDAPGGGMPPGEWTELVGSAYERRIYVYQIATTREQDEHLIASFNDRKNIARYNMLDRNCADFSRNLFDLLYPHSVHRNAFADWGIMTPKQVARSLVSYSRKNPEINLQIFVIPQVPGTVRRSHAIYGCTEGFVKSKKYVIPATVLNPYFAAGMLAVYVVDGRFSPPKNPEVLSFASARTDTVSTATSTTTVSPAASTRSALTFASGDSKRVSLGGTRSLDPAQAY